jgi:hypothetical protein
LSFSLGSGAQEAQVASGKLKNAHLPTFLPLKDNSMFALRFICNNPGLKIETSLLFFKNTGRVNRSMRYKFSRLAVASDLSRPQVSF